MAGFVDHTVCAVGGQGGQFGLHLQPRPTLAAFELAVLGSDVRIIRAEVSTVTGRGLSAGVVAAHAVNRNKNAPDNTARLQRAQVHATLALIAATIQASDMGANKLLDWQRRGLKV